MKERAIRPDMVVRDEEDISGMALERARMQASLGGRCSCSSV